MPADFIRLQDAVRDHMLSFKEYSGGHIIVHYIDPFEGKTEDDKKDIYQQLAQKGIFGMTVGEGDGGEYSEKMVFPYALVNYKGRSEPVTLVENRVGASRIEALNYSESLLEYK